MHLPTSDDPKVPSVFPLRGEPEGHEDPPSNLPAKSSKFQASSNPYLQTPSNPAASSTTGRAVSNFSSFSRIPPNTHGPLAFSTPSCSGISYSTPLSYDTTHSTPKDHSALEKAGRIGIITQNISQDSVCPLDNSPIETTSQVTNSSCSISLSSTLTDCPCSTTVEVGSMESIQRDTNCSSRENSQNSLDPMYSVPHNTPLENENINASPSENRQNSSNPMYSVPPNTPLENENINASPSENRQNSSDPMYSVPPNTPLENENALETSRFPVERQCSSRLQIDASPSENRQNSPDPVYPVPPPNTPLSPLRNSEESLISSKENSDSDNGTRHIKSSVNRNSGYRLYKGNSTYPKSASKENGQKSTRLKNENSSKISILPVKRHRSSRLQTVATPTNTSKCPLRERKRIENATGCTNRLAPNPEDQNQSTKNIKSFKNVNSGCHHFKGNSTYPKSASEKNGQNTTRLKNGNSSKTSIYPVKRHCSSQLQKDASPSNTSKCPLHESKHIENATGCTNRLVLYPDELYPGHEVRPSGNSKAANAFLEDKGRNQYMMSRYSESHAGESLATSNPIKSQPSSDKRDIIENVVESLRQSYISLSMRNDLPTSASEMSVPSNKLDSKQSAHSRNETRKKSKLISCLAACFRSSSPKQERQI